VIRTSLALLLVAAIAVGLLSCGDDRSPVSPDPGVPMLTGRVLDPAHEPIPGSVVRLRMAATDSVTPDSANTDTTDALGRFAFVVPPPGRWVLESIPEPYYFARRFLDVSGAESRSLTVDLMLQPRGAVRGRVSGVAEPDQAGFLVRLLQADSVGVVTAADGIWLFDQVPLGLATVFVERMGWVPRMIELTLTARGDTVEADPIVLVRATEGHYLAGIIRGAQSPLADALVSVQPSNGSGTPRETRTDAAGAYVVDRLTPGAHHVMASAFGHRGLTAEATIAGGPEPTTTLLSLQLQPIGSISGRVGMYDGTPPGGVVVRIQESGRSTTTDVAGDYRFDDLDLGSWTVEFFRDGYLTQVRSTSLVTAGAVTSLSPVTLVPGMLVECLGLERVIADPVVPPATISAPRSIAVSPEGIFYILDTFWGRIQKFDVSGHFLGSWAAKATDVAVEPSGTLLLANGMVERRTTAGALLAKFTSAGTPPFPGKSPFPFHSIDLAVDPAGYFYSTDSNGKVHKFTPGGRAYRYPGIYSLYDGRRPVAASDDRVYLEARDRATTLVCDTTLTVVGNLPGPAIGLEKDGAGGVFIIDPTGTVRHHDRAGTLLNQFGGTGSGPGQFRGLTSMVLAPDGMIYAADFGNARIQILQSDGGYVGEWGGVAPIDNFQSPQHVAVGPDGTIYVSNLAGTIARYSATGDLLKRVSLGENYVPQGMAFGSLGNLYVMTLFNFSGGRLKRYSADLSLLNTFGVDFGDRDQSGPGSYGVDVDGANQIYVADDESDRVVKFNNAGQFVQEFPIAPGETGTKRPFGIAVRDNGGFLVTDYARHRVERYSPEGGLVGSWGSEGSGPGEFRRPTGIAIGAGGHVFVADTGNRRIQEFTSLGQYVGEFTMAGAGDTPLVTPLGLAADLIQRRLYVVDGGAEAIKVYQFAGPGCP